MARKPKIYFWKRFKVSETLSETFRGFRTALGFLKNVFLESTGYGDFQASFLPVPPESCGQNDKHGMLDLNRNKTSNDRLLDSLDHRLNKAEIFSVDTDTDRIDLFFLSLNSDSNFSRIVNLRNSFYSKIILNTRIFQLKVIKKASHLYPRRL